MRRKHASLPSGSRVARGTSDAGGSRAQSSLGSRPSHHGWREVAEGGRTQLLQGGAGLLAQDVEYTLDARLTEGAKTPKIGPADAHGTRPERERFHDVGATPEAAVDQHGQTAAGDCHDLRQSLDGGAAAVLGAA